MFYPLPGKLYLKMQLVIAQAAINNIPFKNQNSDHAVGGLVKMKAKQGSEGPRDRLASQSSRMREK
jgi:hypothetical protein